MPKLGSETTLFYKIVVYVVRSCFKIFGKVYITGMDNVPPYGPLIVVVNHLSNNDPPLIASMLTRPLDFLGKKELFSNPFMGMLLRKLRVYPINRSASAEGMKVAMGLLDWDHALAIFPEGQRSPTGRLQSAKPGAAYLALKSQAPILPIGVYGTEKYPPWRMLLPFRKLYINIGQPFSLPVIEGAYSRGVITGASHMIMTRLADLLPDEYKEGPQ
jgi:1-acyl-sn-glycerol-3-phosphate acyltransferase